MKAFSAILFHVASPDVEASDPKGHVHKNNQKHREKKKEEDDPRLGVKASKKHDKTGKYCRYTEIKQLVVQPRIASFLKIILLQNTLCTVMSS